MTETPEVVNTTEMLEKLNSVVTPEQLKEWLDDTVVMLMLVLREQNRLADDLDITVDNHGLDDPRSGIRLDDQYGNSMFILFGDDEKHADQMYRGIISWDFQLRISESLQEDENNNG